MGMLFDATAQPTFVTSANANFQSTRPAATVVVMETMVGGRRRRVRVEYVVQGALLLAANEIPTVSAAAMGKILDTFTEIVDDTGDEALETAQWVRNAVLKATRTRTCTLDLMRILAFTAWPGYGAQMLSFTDPSWSAINEHLGLGRGVSAIINTQMPTNFVGFLWATAPAIPREAEPPRVISWAAIE